MIRHLLSFLPSSLLKVHYFTVRLFQAVERLSSWFMRKDRFKLDVYFYYRWCSTRKDCTILIWNKFLQRIMETFSLLGPE